jgi:hypothetical protein
MYDGEQRMKEIMEAPQLYAMETSKLCSDQLNRFLTFKNKMDFPTHHPTHEKVEVPFKLYHHAVPNEPVETTLPVHAHYF